MKDTPENELFSAYLDGEVDAAEQAEVEQLLATSPAARQLMEELRALSSTLQALPPYQLDEDLSDRVLRTAERQILTQSDRHPVPAPAPRRPILRRMLNPRAVIWSGLAVAAALLIMMMEPGQLDRGEDRKVARVSDPSDAPPLAPSIGAVEAPGEPMSEAPADAPAEAPADGMPRLESGLSVSATVEAKSEKAPAGARERELAGKGGSADRSVIEVPKAVPAEEARPKRGSAGTLHTETLGNGQPAPSAVPMVGGPLRDKANDLKEDGSGRERQITSGKQGGSGFAAGRPTIPGGPPDVGGRGLNSKHAGSAYTDRVSSPGGRIGPADRLAMFPQMDDGVVIVEVSPEALRQKSFNRVLSDNAIDGKETVVDGEAQAQAQTLATAALHRFRQRESQDRRQEKSSQRADLADTYLVWVEATPAQIAGTLDDLTEEVEQRGEFASLRVEPELGTQVQQDWDKYSRSRGQLRRFGGAATIPAKPGEAATDDAGAVGQDLKQQEGGLVATGQPQRGNAWMFQFHDRPITQTQPPNVQAPDPAATVAEPAEPSPQADTPKTPKSAVAPKDRGGLPSSAGRAPADSDAPKQRVEGLWGAQTMQRGLRQPPPEQSRRYVLFVLQVVSPEPPAAAAQVEEKPAANETDVAPAKEP
ncbi:MAG: hypothetical protein A2V70_00820 [Planctomycetes bacterium RBG_13_63_9]|nr:MAG: hypothetical protein A2V70_00820 [Planctomycetes bacterium RBG_13_63_9]